ncbi:MAG: dockerin type I domain-containing protein [Planctomycetota bacterium]
MDSLFVGNIAGVLDGPTAVGRPDLVTGDVSVSSEGFGGAIGVVDPFGGASSQDFSATHLVLDSVAMVGNTGYLLGGGLFAGGESSQVAVPVSLTVANSLAYAKSAQQGGGIWAKDGSIAHSTVAFNNVGFREEDGTPIPSFTLVSGGGIFAAGVEAGVVSVDISSSIIFGNALAGYVVRSIEDSEGVPIPPNSAAHSAYGADLGVVYDTLELDVVFIPEEQLNDIFVDVRGEHSIFGSISDSLPSDEFGGESNSIRNAQESFLSSTSSVDNALLIADELSELSGTHFLPDCTRMPFLPLLPGSSAINAGPGIFNETSGNYPTVDGLSITEDLRGPDFDRLRGVIDVGSHEFGGIETSPTGDELTIFLDYSCLRPALDRATDLLEMHRLSNDQVTGIDGFERRIEEELQRVYGVFQGVHVTADEADLPRDGNGDIDPSLFDTIVFHPGSAPGLLGTSQQYFGDYRNLFTGDVTEVFPNQFAGVLDDPTLGYGSSSPTDAAFVDDFIAMLVGTAAHEHAHSAGLQHYDPYGDPDLNSANNFDPDPFDFDPAFQVGIFTAGQQNGYVMATGSTGLGAVGRTSVRTFSPQSMAKYEFSYGMHGDWQPNLETLLRVTAEDPNLTSSAAGQDIGLGTAQQLPITGLRAVNVTGEFLPGAVAPKTHRYQFAGDVDDVVTINVLSESMLRAPGGKIGLDVRLYDAPTDELVGVNASLAYSPTAIGEHGIAPLREEDDFVTHYGESIDEPLLLNVELPTTGVYRIEIQRPDGPNVGRYELFATLDRASDQLAGDYYSDGSVNVVDYQFWRDSYAAYVAAGYGPDGTNDGIVDAADFTVWADNKGPDVFGDFNNDQIVDTADYTVWRDTRGSTTDLGADENEDGIVNYADYLIWVETFGSTVPAPTFTLGGTPENAALVDPLLPPQVLDVVVSGTNSQHADYSFDTVDGSGSQLDTVPVGGADTISITFSEDVEVSGTDLRLIGTRSGNTPTLSTFSYDLFSRTASWTFTGWTFGDQYVIELADTVQDLDGNALDGEWVNPVNLNSTSTSISTFPSGDGNAGGDFVFLATILPGDANQDGKVDLLDHDILGSNWGTQQGAQFSGADYNGDGSVDLLDLEAHSIHYGDDYTDDIFLLSDLADGDLDIDQADLTRWDLLYADSNDPDYLDADLDGDGDVDLDDRDLVLAQFGLNIETELTI